MIGGLLKVLFATLLALIYIIMVITGLAVIIGIIAVIIVIVGLLISCIKEVVEDELYRSIEAAERHAKS